MYTNKCTKCGVEFETKNPKRVICPSCLYPDRKDLSLQSYSDALNAPPVADAPQQDSATPKKPSGFFVAGESQEQQNFNKRREFSEGQQDYQPRRDYQPRDGGYNRDGGQGGYNRDYQQPRRDYQPREGGYNRDGGHGGGYNRDYQQPRRDYQPREGGYNRDGGQGGYNRDGQQGGYRDGGQGGGFNRQRPQFNRDGGGYNRDGQQGGYRDGGNRFNNGPRPGGGGFRPGGRPPMGGGGFRRPGPPQGRFPNRGFGGPGGRGPAVNKKLLISREQVAEIEKYYMELLPLPNPDCHEVIGEKMSLESNKVFFGINLVRQKMKLPKLPFPKRKLAVSTDQLIAIKNLYEPLLPLPPIGCHKFISKQLRMDEWRVHVGIGIIRKQMNLPRWNTERDDAPAEFKNQPVEAPVEAPVAEVKEVKETKKRASKAEKAEPVAEKVEE